MMSFILIIVIIIFVDVVVTVAVFNFTATLVEWQWNDSLSFKNSSSFIALEDTLRQEVSNRGNLKLDSKLRNFDVLIL